jgi:hypothetical protein
MLELHFLMHTYDRTFGFEENSKPAEDGFFAEGESRPGGTRAFEEMAGDGPL